MDASTARTMEPVFAHNPDRSRPAIPTAAAAERLNLSRYYVSELVRLGKIDGYGIRRHEGGRTRWFVYEDALADKPDHSASASSALPAEIVEALTDTQILATDGRAARRVVEDLLLAVIGLMSEAIGAIQDGDERRAVNLLTEAHTKRSDEERQRAKAKEFEDRTVAHLNELVQAVRSRPGQEVSGPERLAGQRSYADASVLSVVDRLGRS